MGRVLGRAGHGVNEGHIRDGGQRRQKSVVPVEEQGCSRSKSFILEGQGRKEHGV